MNCHKYQNLIESLLENELEAKIAEQVNLHVFACPECALEYETMKREKEIYASYLFGVEPANDLQAKFQMRLEAEKSKSVPVSVILAESSGWKSKIFGFSFLTPTFAGVIILIILGVSLWNFTPDKKVADNEYIAKREVRNNRQKINESGEYKKDLPAKSEDAKISETTKNKRTNERRKSLSKKAVDKTSIKFIPVRKAKLTEKNVVKNAEVTEEIARISDEERLQKLQFKKSEIEIAGQIEKVEILLRSFRNARITEDGESFDVAYEKQQARKLLDKNYRLRQSAEFYGNLYAEEILGKAEPILLDIANLNDDFSPEKITDIKERVSNQNLIASLQVY